MLVAVGLVAPHDAIAAVRRGTDVYLFLAGMMVLAELARREGVFDWVAALAVRVAAGSRMRLFSLVYGVGVVVTVVLSNDATAVVLTPAVAAAVRRAKAEPLPYLFACAFVANAASFVLPISNPANLVIFASAMPALGRWFAIFGWPSLAAIVATYVLLAWTARRTLAGETETRSEVPPLARSGVTTLCGIAATAIALGVASSRGAQLGIVTSVAALVVFAFVVAFDRRAIGVLTSVSWSVLPLVAGLFVLVQAMDATGVLELARRGVAVLAHEPAWRAIFTAGVATALVSNVTNNLPAGLLAGLSLQQAPHPDSLAGATTIGIDLGPNLSVTGSLATVLWLIALRRERIEVRAWTFLRAGAIVMPPALLLALGALYLASR